MESMYDVENFLGSPPLTASPVLSVCRFCGGDRSRHPPPLSPLVVPDSCVHDGVLRVHNSPICVLTMTRFPHIDSNAVILPNGFADSHSKLVGVTHGSTPIKISELGIHRAKDTAHMWRSLGQLIIIALVFIIIQLYHQVNEASGACSWPIWGYPAHNARGD